MTSVEKLCKLIFQKFGIECNIKSFRRVRPGHWQRAAGSYSWVITEKNGWRDIGSIYSVKKLLKNWDKVDLIKDSTGYELIF